MGMMRGGGGGGGGGLVEVDWCPGGRGNLRRELGWTTAWKNVLCSSSSDCPCGSDGRRISLFFFLFFLLDENQKR